MIIKFAGKRVVNENEEYVGVIVEHKDGEIVARRYFKNGFKTYLAEDGYQIIEFPKVKKMRTPISKVREISRQLGISDYAISKEAIDYIMAIS